MQEKQLASLSLKLLGIYSVVQSIPLLQPIGMAYETWLRFTDQKINVVSFFISALIPSFLLIVLGCALIIFSGRLSEKLVFQESFGQTASSDSGRDLQAIAFSVLGAAIFVLAIPKFGQTICYLFLTSHSTQSDYSEQLSRGNIPYIVGFIVQFVIGAGLFFGAKPLTAFWHRLQKEWRESKEK